MVEVYLDPHRGGCVDREDIQYIAPPGELSPDPDHINSLISYCGQVGSQLNHIQRGAGYNPTKHPLNFVGPWKPGDQRGRVRNCYWRCSLNQPQEGAEQLTLCFQVGRKKSRRHDGGFGQHGGFRKIV